MAVEEENNKKNEGKGFAGLSSLVSDVDTTPPPPAPKTGSAESTTSTGRPASQAAQPQPLQPTQRQTYQEPPQPSSGSSGGKWILGIAAVVGLLWLIGQSNKNTPSPAPAYSPPVQSVAPSYSPPAQPKVPSQPQESKPPVGQDLVFSTAQIRYCLAEDIRMDGAKAALNNYSDSDVDRFNAMVADYNSRCGSFRYRSGALESARRDVEPYRGQLQVEGRSRFARSPSTGSLSAPAPTRPAADETVRAVQQKLNELGYSAGPADGLIGPSTRSAIQAFQRDNGLVVDGKASAALLQILSNARRTASGGSFSPSVEEVPPTHRPPASASSPASASRSSSREIPQNARLNYLGDDWECNKGYFRRGNECHAVIIPQNGKITYLGNDWECNRGYFRRGNECHAVQTPQNGRLTYLGNDWECERGYRKSGDRCIPVFQQ